MADRVLLTLEAPQTLPRKCLPEVLPVKVVQKGNTLGVRMIETLQYMRNEIYSTASFEPKPVLFVSSGVVWGVSRGLFRNFPTKQQKHGALWRVSFGVCGRRL